jgi:hypothetical protein
MLFTLAQDATVILIVEEKIMSQNSKVFDIIVLAGMVVNLILAVFLILYYFDFL